MVARMIPEAVQDPVNMLSAFVFMVLFLGTVGALIAHWWLTRLLDGDQGRKMYRYCGHCLREIEDEKKWQRDGCDCGGRL